ncbi:MAG: amidase [SAR202 cluster bacterium]|nr:amidase [SAR202 cluster bacterium]
MAGIDLKEATIAGVSELIKAKKVSPVEVTEATLRRIEKLNPILKCFTTVTGEYAMSKAKEAEKEVMAGRYKGPLHGIPYTLKDLIDTKGIRTTYGYSSHQDYVPNRSARVHELMEEAGGILVGKVDCHFRRDVAVQCYNPWDLERSPGHSSSGSGSAVGASLGLTSIGSDTGGSVRIPAAWSGVVGMKTTFGLMTRHNLFGPSWSFDQAGPLAKTVEDTAIVLQAIAGYDHEDPVSIAGERPDYRKGLKGGIKGLRVGVLEEYVGSHSTEEVEASVREAVRVLERLGATSRAVEIAEVGEFPNVHNTIVDLESAVYYYQQFPPERMEQINPDMKGRLKRGFEITMSQYIKAQEKLAFLRREVERVFREVDVVVSPTCLTPPLKVGQTRSKITVRGKEVDARTLTLRNTSISSDCHLPAISVPCGFAEGPRGPLPIGLHIIGRRLEDALVLRAAYAYEQATEWHKRRAPL